MPSLRVLSVVVLVGMGAAVAAVGGVGEPGELSDQLRSGLITARPEASATASVSQVIGTLSLDGGSATAVGTSATTGAAFDVSAENKRAGTPGWRINKARGTKPGLAGYAGAVSALPGQSVPLFVSGDGPVRIRALRIGWYGGVGARQVWEGTLRAQQESADPRNWPARGLVDTTGWPEGHYLLRLDQGDASRYLPLTLRSVDNRDRVVLLTSPMTWVAENPTGTSTDTAASATSTPGQAQASAPADTSAQTSAQATISFNRPYSIGYGSAGFLRDDAGMIQLAERTGRRTGFVTDHDVSTDPRLLTDAAAVVIGGDSQYWTPSLRTTIRAAGDAGTNLAFLGAGTGARRVDLTDAGRALQISPGNPSTSVRLTGLRPSCSVTSSTSTAQGAEPETAANSSGVKKAGWVIANGDWWGYRGAGVKTDDVLPGLVSGRVDRASTSSAGSTTPLQVLSLAQVTCGKVAGTVAQSGVYLVRPSGAGVFASGTSRWGCALTNKCTNRSGAPAKLDKATRRAVTRITLNVIKAFAEKKAGNRLAAKNTASQYSALR